MRYTSYILNLNARWSLSASLLAWLYPPGRMNPRDSLDVVKMKKRLLPLMGIEHRFLDYPAHTLVAIQTGTSWFHI
jgi:hypothetical protein